MRLPKPVRPNVRSRRVSHAEAAAGAAAALFTALAVCSKATICAAAAICAMAGLCAAAAICSTTRAVADPSADAIVSVETRWDVYRTGADRRVGSMAGEDPALQSWLTVAPRVSIAMSPRITSPSRPSSRPRAMARSIDEASTTTTIEASEERSCASTS